MLDLVAQQSTDALAWPRPFVLEWQSCGFINAQWVETTQKLTLCYELAQDFAQLYRDYNVEPEATKQKFEPPKSKKR